jgi:hypothetical protein
MPHRRSDTDELLTRVAAANEPSARGALLDHHRRRLRRMIAPIPGLPHGLIRPTWCKTSSWKPTGGLTLT